MRNDHKVLFLLILVAATINGCASSSAQSSIEANYVNRSASEVKKELEGKGMTCFHSELVVTEEGTGQSAIDSGRRKLNCYIIQRKNICPEKKSVMLVYSVASEAIVSKTFISSERQCF